jgi:NADPH:quinone reductase-like Zn-dependent oxidoreductase
MKAIVCQGYGDPDALRLEDVDPPAPGAVEILIRVRAASLNALDWHLMKGRPPVIRLFLGLGKPRMDRPGRDVAGTVQSVGSGVTRFKPGDSVFGICQGSLAEYARASESAVIAKPPTVSFESAASVPIAGLTALQALRDHGRLRAGQRVLINGASGGVGTTAVQIARCLGADVNGVCGSRNIETVRALGAHRVFDYTREDFTRSGDHWDLILDLAANHSISDYRRVLNRGGVIVVAGGGGSDGHAMGRRLVRSMMGALVAKLVGQRMVFFVARLKLEDLSTLGEWMASGKVTPVIDSRHALGEASQAMRRLAAGHACGKVVVTVGGEGAASGT